MYNEGQKLEYIDETKYINLQLPKLLNTIFTQTEPLEEKAAKDIGEWTSAEIISYYKSLSRSSLNSLAVKHSQLRKYAEWCLERNLLSDNQNHYGEIDMEILKTCLNVGLLENGIITRAELNSMIVELLNPRDQCLVYALFEGIEGKQFSELTALNVKQIKGNKLKLATRTIPVHPRLLELMRESTEEYKYYTYGDKISTMRYPADDDNVFKMTPNSTETSPIRQRQRLYTNLTRIKDFIGNSAINATSLIESGRIDMVKGLMEKEPDISVEEVIQKHSAEIYNKYGKIYSLKNYMLSYGKYYERE